ncbi:GNAT family N-acetyltransferase [Candidatus Micrarchaeota archaeon]|nr:GNAT family N-acetyltransferase [Candidatus Micrarchaeota archaeon]
MNKRKRGSISARIEGKRVVIPYERTFLSYGESRKPLMVSNVPGEKGKALVWMKAEGKSGNHVYAVEFDVKSKAFNPTSSAISRTRDEAEQPLRGKFLVINDGKYQFVNHLIVDENRRGKGIGTAAVEILINEARIKGKETVAFPRTLGHPNEYYKKLGANEFNEVDLKKLNEKSIEWPDVLKRKGFKIYWTAGTLNKKK